MEIINNVTKTLRDDLSVEIKSGSKLSIAAACFSIYAFQALKQELENIDELRFIFTSPAFTTEKSKKEKREFYIPRLDRERSLYGTEFEVKLRNELTQKAIAKECAEWIRKKVRFKSNVSEKYIQGGIAIDDRTPKDLLFQVMLDLGVLLSSKIDETTISGKKIFNVADGFLVACFDNDVTEDVITEIAKKKPYYFVIRDSSMANDNVATNFEQIFATYSPDTVRKVL